MATAELVFLNAFDAGALPPELQSDEELVQMAEQRVASMVRFLALLKQCHRMSTYLKHGQVVYKVTLNRSIENNPPP